MAMLRALFLLVTLMQLTAGLLVPASAVTQRSSCVARSIPQMAMPSLKDAKGLSDEDIAKEILTAQKARCSPPLCRPSFAVLHLHLTPRPPRLPSRSCLSCARR